MSLEESHYNFHDAIVVSCEMVQTNSLQLTLLLYEINHPNKEQVQLTFSGIFNLEKVTQFITQLNAEALAPDWNGTRVDKFNSNHKQVSKTLNQHFILNLDGFKSLKIHCKELQIEKVARHA